jgi:hypothetical protein
MADGDRRRRPVDLAAEIARAQDIGVDIVERARGERAGGEEAGGEAKSGPAQLGFPAMIGAMRPARSLASRSLAARSLAARSLAARSLAAATLLAALVGGAGARPAAAQFYDLDGAYHCLTQPSAACEAGLKEHPAPPALPPDPNAGVRTLDEVIAHVRTKEVTGHDLEILEHAAASKDARAIEVLAWCRLNGIGGAADAIAAYRLYGAAADLGVPNARKNQIAIYESRLTPEQRQEVLLPQHAH